jgi:hypothetical protein
MAAKLDDLAHVLEGLGLALRGAALDRPYDYAACRQYLEAGEADCLTRACAARRACPIGRETRYSEQQATFHIRAFLGNRLG